MFDIERFIEDCRQAAADGDESHKAVREIVARAVAEPDEMLSSLGEPTEAGIQKLYHGSELTILNTVWATQMTVMPHNHRMWAVIGIFAGGEDNIFWRREEGGLTAAGARALRVGDAAPLGRDIVHSVSNPTDKLTCAIHVYGGDFFATARSEWDPETLAEKPFDIEKTLRLFAEANARYVAGKKLGETKIAASGG